MSEFQPIDSTRSPRMAQPATFMRLPFSRDLDRLDVALLGIPYDGGTSYRPGARFGPREIRNQSSIIRPYNPVMDASPFASLNIADYGDIDPAPVSIESTYELIEHGIGELLAKEVMPVTVGGDHSITLPILRAIAAKQGPVGLVHFDSHPDTWDEYFGGKFFHGTPFRRAVEEGVVDPKRMIQVGIRGSLYDRSDFDFQREHGYPKSAPGKANLTMCTNQIAHAFGAVSMTLEQPFKDNADRIDPQVGWSPARCRALGRAQLDALADVIDDLPRQSQ